HDRFYRHTPLTKPPRGSFYVLRAVLSRSLAQLAFEDNAHVLGVFVTGQRGNPVEWQVGLAEQLFYAFELDISDLGLRRATDKLPEPTLQNAARDWNMLQNLDDGDPVARMLANVFY